MSDFPIDQNDNVTTPVDPREARDMSSAFCQDFGNSFLAHRYGKRTKQRGIEPRADVGRLIGTSSVFLLLTGSATGANNLAILRFARLHSGKKSPLILSARRLPSDRMLGSVPFFIGCPIQEGKVDRPVNLLGRSWESLR